MNSLETLQNLVKALEAGQYNAAPSTLVQGSALQMEDLTPVLVNVGAQDKHIKLLNSFKSENCKSMLAQFVRQLSYGVIGGSAVGEGHVGNEEDGQYVRITYPMCFYSTISRRTVQAEMVATVDGVSAEERVSQNCAKKLAVDQEFDIIKGHADFSNAGVFDGNSAALPLMLPNMKGIDQQIRESDSQRNAQDLMFNSYGSDASVVMVGGGNLSQSLVEDMRTRSAMSFGDADRLLVDPIVGGNYNKLTLGKERIVLAGSATERTGSTLRTQSTFNGDIKIEMSRFLSGRSSPIPARSNGPAAPNNVTAASSAIGGSPTAFTAGQVYKYLVTTGNEVGESPAFPVVSQTVTNNADAITLTITHPGAGVARWFNVYRSVAGGTKTLYIGRVKLVDGAGSTPFVDLGNASPGFVTGYLVQDDTWLIKEMAPFTRMKLAVTALNTPEAYFRFLCLGGLDPRKNVLCANLQ